MKIDKTHSRLDLIELINTIDIPIVFSHVDNKKDIHRKITDLFLDTSLQKPLYSPNVYKINTYTDLRFYLEKANPKKQLSVKERKEIMKICKHIIFYCKNGKCLEYSDYYNDQQQLKDDMDYIKRWGDIPSVRRCCRLMNDGLKEHEQYIPLVSPQVQLIINNKIKSKPHIPTTIIIHKGPHTISFK